MQTLSYYWLESYKYELAEDFIIKLPFGPPEDITQNECQKAQFFTTNILIICKGFFWDGCSGPTIDDKTNQRAGLVHDVLAYFVRKGLISMEWYLKYGSKIFRDIFIFDAIAWAKKNNKRYLKTWLCFRAWYYYKAVSNKFLQEDAMKKAKDMQDEIINIEYEEY